MKSLPSMYGELTQTAIPEQGCRVHALHFILCHLCSIGNTICNLCSFFRAAPLPAGCLVIQKKCCLFEQDLLLMLSFLHPAIYSSRSLVIDLSMPRLQYIDLVQIRSGKARLSQFSVSRAREREAPGVWSCFKRQPKKRKGS